MSGAFDRKLRDVRRRWSVNILLEQLALMAMLAGTATALAVLTERALALRFVAGWHLAAGGAIAAVAAAGLWLRRRPSPIQAALLLDERLATRERFSTALAVARSEDPFAAAACEEAHRAAEDVRLGKHFPVCFTRRWLWAAAAWTAFAACLLLPEMDLFGHGAERAQLQKKAQELAQAKAQVVEKIAPIQSRIEQLGDKALAEDLASLDDLDKSLQADDLKRQAIRKLSDLDKKLSELQQAPEVQAVQELESMLRRLKGDRGDLDQQLTHALAAGDFDKAGKILEDLKERLEAGKLTQEQREALARQLENLARQMAELAADKKALEDALKQAGCDSKLANLSPDQLRKALKDAGLSEEQIKKIMDKAQAQQIAQMKCKSLGKSLGKCAGGLCEGTGAGAAGEMAGTLEELDNLEAMKDRMKLVKATQEEIDAAIALLGQGQCAGGLCQGNGPGNPNGPPQQAWGNRDTGGDEPTNTAKTGVANQDTEEGPIVASTYVKGPQIKGTSKRDYQAVVAAAKDRAAEAVSENKVPRQYQSAVKDYFDEMGDAGK